MDIIEADVRDFFSIVYDVEVILGVHAFAYVDKDKRGADQKKTKNRTGSNNRPAIISLDPLAPDPIATAIEQVRHLNVEMGLAVAAAPALFTGPRRISLDIKGLGFGKYAVADACVEVTGADDVNAAPAEDCRQLRRSDATADFYEAKAGHLARLLPITLAQLKERGAAEVDAYIEARRAETAAETTIAKELVTLRASLKIAKRRGLWDGDPSAILPIGFSPEYKPRTRCLTPAELYKLLPHLLPDHAARVAFIVATSANWNETERAQRIDVQLNDAEADVVHVRGTKRQSRDRIVPVTLPAHRECLRYAMKYAAGEENLFLRWQNVRRDLHVACKHAGIAPCSPNDLRRTYSQWLRGIGVDKDLIAATMGHADSRMVERVYGKLPTDVLQARLAAQCDTNVIDASEKADAVDRNATRRFQKSP